MSLLYTILVFLSAIGLKSILFPCTTSSHVGSFIQHFPCWDVILITMVSVTINLKFGLTLNVDEVLLWNTDPIDVKTSLNF